MSRRWSLLLLALVLAGCGSPESPEPPEQPRADPAPSRSTPAAAAPAWRTLAGPLQRCGPQPPAVQAADWRPTVLRDPAVGRVPAVRLGRGPVTLVLLHETEGGGLCGWLPFMPVAAEAGYAVLALDLCDHGAASCRRGSDQTAAVAMAVDAARGRAGTERVVVVGASMGGSVALIGAATLPGIDAVADLSGPVDWRGSEVVREGRALGVPALVAMAATEGADQVAGARRIVEHAPPGSELLTPESGHGYALLLADDGAEPPVQPVGQRLLAWLAETVGR